MLMKTLLSQLFQAIRQRHGYVWVEREYDPCLPIEMTNLVASGTAEAPAEFKLAA
jgi:hypothetical protein